MAVANKVKVDELVEQFIAIQSRDFKEIKIEDSLLADDQFYPLVNTLRKMACAKRRINFADFINFDFVSAENSRGANQDLDYRRLILQLCVATYLRGRY